MSELNKKKVYKTRKPWSIDNELLLINIWSTKTRQLRGPQKRWQIAKEIAEEIQRCGRSYSSQEVKMKMINLTTKYRKEKGNAGPSQWVLYKQMHNLIRSIEKSNGKTRDNANHSFYGMSTNDTSALEIEKSDRLSSVSNTSSQPLDEPVSIASSSSSSSISSLSVSRSPSPVQRDTKNRIDYQQEIVKQLVAIGTEFRDINSELKKTNIELKKRNDEITALENRKTDMLQQYVNDVSELKNAFLKFLSEK